MAWENDLYETLAPIVALPHNYPETRPLLAHYTSLQVLESIAAHGEIWMSHPLMMNDTQEMTGGLDAARAVFLQNADLIDALGQHVAIFAHWYQQFEAQFLSNDAFDTYIFCLSEHEPNDMDGILSMWRGYGGNGGGAAVVFNTGRLVYVEQQTPFLLSRVAYRSAVERDSVLATLAVATAKMLRNGGLSETNAAAAANQLFRMALTNALFTKHHGFREENEWRLVYMRDLDESLERRKFHVHLGPRGPEPKLKVLIENDQHLSGAPLNLDLLVDRILLGPAASSGLAKFAVQRMLWAHERTTLVASRVSASTTPFRIVGQG